MRNRVDRYTSHSDIFSYFYYKVNRGALYFLINIERDYEKIIKSAIKLLQDEGIGGDRSIGKGLGNLEFKDFELNTPNNANCFINLSLYYPEYDELIKFKDSKNIISYDLIERGGWVDSIVGNFRKKAINMFVEGSIFPKIDGKEFYGKLVPVYPNPLIYRYGIAYAIDVIV
ncbi:hypothetical protein HRbin06_00410 [archaeon HR06]|nr:hypothetical protein HRbin06_00410 [archaeon HR06]